MNFYNKIHKNIMTIVENIIIIFTMLGFSSIIFVGFIYVMEV